MNELKASEIAQGIKVAMVNIAHDLTETIDDMTTKQLRRSLEVTVNVLGNIESEKDRDIAALSANEQKYIGQLIALIKNSQAYHVYEVSELEKKKQSEQEGEEDGKE